MHQRDASMSDSKSDAARRVSSSLTGGTILNQINEITLKPSQTGLSIVLAIFAVFYR